MTWEPLVPAWDRADVDAANLWQQSGCAWLTARGVAVPVRLVREAAGLVAFLDARGAGLAGLVGAAGVGLLGERAAVLGLTPSGTTSCGGAGRLLRSADGWVAVTMARADDIAAIPAWLGTGIGEAPWDSIEVAVRSETSDQLVGQAIELGLACAAVGEVVDSRPVLMEPHGPAPPRPLAGTVVANLASLWAGPLAGDVLARLGARVITIESSTRPDGARNQPPFFEALHGRCESVALELNTDRGRGQLRQLLTSVDVVVEGSRPRALEQMGVDAHVLTRSGPKLWVTITGYGRDLPLGYRVGFGDDSAAAGGLVGWVGEAPTFLADAVADPLTGLTVAATIAQLLEASGRWLVDVALSRVAAGASGLDGVPVRSSVSPQAPTRRVDPGAPLPLGRDTGTVLREFGIEP